MSSDSASKCFIGLEWKYGGCFIWSHNLTFFLTNLTMKHMIKTSLFFPFNRYNLSLHILLKKLKQTKAKVLGIIFHNKSTKASRPQINRNISSSRSRNSYPDITFLSNFRNWRTSASPFAFSENDFLNMPRKGSAVLW